MTVRLVQDGGKLVKLNKGNSNLSSGWEIEPNIPSGVIREVSERGVLNYEVNTTGKE